MQIQCHRTPVFRSGSVDYLLKRRVQMAAHRQKIQHKTTGSPVPHQCIEVLTCRRQACPRNKETVWVDAGCDIIL